MACLECGLEQAVADAGTCARCGAPLPGAGSWAGTFSGPGGRELGVDGSGIHLRGEPNAPERLISWDEIGWFRDGWKEPGWMLHIVLAGGGVERVTETWTAGGTQVPPELLALIRRAAAAHSIPAVLTGGKVCDGLPGDNDWNSGAGLYYDPAGEPGLREWTGTEWSPFLQVDPGASGHPGQEAGLARIWAPLPPAELHRHSRAILKDTRATMVAVPGCASFLTLALVLIAVLMASGHLHGSSGPKLAAFVGAFWALYVAVGVSAVRDARKRKRIALALSADATRALAQDDPPAPIEPPDLRTN
jgi:hypothetical protein